MRYNSTEHPISWLRSRYMEKSLEIRPPYQRKPVWTARQKSYLIESILMQLPVPEIYVQHVVSPEGEETYAVVDGQQRVRTVLQFIGVELDPEEAEHNKFVLDKLEASSPYMNASFDSLTPEQKQQFYKYNFAVRYLETNSEAEVRDMFARLNKNLSPLKPQELRNAIYAGPFSVLSGKLADHPFWAQYRIITPAAIRRMGDIEFVSDLLIGTMHGPQAGNAQTIDEYYKIYEDYEDEFPDQPRITDRFRDTLSLIRRALPDLAETRWGNKTDFYTLFVAIATTLRVCRFIKGSEDALGERLKEFGREVDIRLSDEEADVSEDAADYVRAVQRGATDKARRATRHRAMMKVIDPFFRPRTDQP